MEFSPDGGQRIAIADGSVVSIVRISKLGHMVWDALLVQEQPVVAMQWHPVASALFLLTATGKNVFCWQSDGCRSLQIPVSVPMRLLAFRPNGIGELLLATGPQPLAAAVRAGGFCLAVPDWLLPTDATIADGSDGIGESVGEDAGESMAELVSDFSVSSVLVA